MPSGVVPNVYCANAALRGRFRADAATAYAKMAL